MPVSGLSRPILTLSAARAVITNGEATCATPATAAAFTSVRRSIFIEKVSDAIIVLPLFL